MTAVPQLGVPEIFVDDEGDPPDGSGATPLFSPNNGRTMGDAASTSIDRFSPGPLRNRPDSWPSSPSNIGGLISPQLSPNVHRPTFSDTYSNDLPGALGGDRSEPGSASHSRQNSAVSAQEVLDVLDNSAWGESIRRSFTARRSRQGSSAAGRGADERSH